jgi:hypothetical protein
MPKTPEEMLKLSEKATKGPWNIFENSNDDLDIYSGKIMKSEYGMEASWIAVVENESANGNDQYREDAVFIAESREFVPCAAEWMIKAKELFKNIEWVENGDSGLLYCPQCGYIKSYGHGDHCKLKKLLDSPHEK